MYPYGPWIEQLPSGYVPRQQWPEYDITTTLLPRAHPRYVGSGTRWGMWPLYFEEYVQQAEPVLSPQRKDPARIVIWQRVVPLGRCIGWTQFSFKPAKLEGFSMLEPGMPYEKTWSESARRYLKKWRTQYAGTQYVIEPITYEEFAETYKDGTVYKHAQEYQLRVVKALLGSPKSRQHTTLWGARRLDIGKIDATLVVVSSPSTHSSYYQAACIRRNIADAPLMIGLMDHWHAYAVTNGIKFLHFGGFWKPGDPKQWKGFSLFKSKFNPQYIAYPPALFRFAKGTILRRT
ncbi:MAG: hypothetical protein V4474_00880 [Patescibacteria group bacterium]